VFRFGEIGDGAFGGVRRFVVFFEKVGLEEEECDSRGLSGILILQYISNATSENDRRILSNSLHLHKIKNKM
jgi:hypothetical protein